MGRPADRRAWLVVAGSCIGIAWACRSAASVILDLPPPSSSGRSAVAAQAAAPQPPALIQTAPPIESLQNADSVLALLPRDSSGAVDWAAAARNGVVRPRPGLPGRPAPPTSPFPYDFVFDVEGGDFDAVFPHSTHTEWLACRGCHPAVYRYRGRRTSMEAIDTGASCGLCHGTVAFTSAACWRCHPQQEPGGHLEATLAADIVFTRDSTAREAIYPPAQFSHAVHRIRYQCTACHTELFAMKRGTTHLSMASMRQGASCGACHDARNAFGLDVCTRCHVVGSPPAAKREGPGG